MLIFSKRNQLTAYLQGQKRTQSIGFVPTMGALHNGHMALIDQCKTENNLSVCSIFVNPTQFNNKEDLEKYPRLIEKDILLLEKHQCDVLFYPTAEEMYAEGEELLEIGLENLGEILEGEHRPGHFIGVATVVKKLFDIVQPDKAYFGLKDFQQVLVVKKMVQMLGVKVEIVPVPTVREATGLAMSSRNMRLSDDEKQKATIIYQTFNWVQSQLSTLNPAQLSQQATQRINTMAGATVEYFELADAITLEPIKQYHPGQKIVALTAVNMGNVRLIDNMLLG